MELMRLEAELGDGCNKGEVSETAVFGAPRRDSNTDGGASSNLWTHIL